MTSSTPRCDEPSSLALYDIGQGPPCCSLTSCRTCCDCGGHDDNSHLQIGHDEVAIDGETGDFLFDRALRVRMKNYTLKEDKMIILRGGRKGLTLVQ